MITTQIELDVSPGGIPPVIHVSQYDTGSRTLLFNLVSGMGDLVLPQQVHAAIRGRKPDGNGFDYEAEFTAATGNTPPVVTVDVTEQMTAAAGKAVCEVYLYQGTPATTEKAASSDYAQLATANFILDVERAALDKDALISGSEIRQLVDVIDRTDELIAAAQYSDSVKAQIEQLYSQTENAKVRAESSAAEAASEAEEAAGYAGEAAAILTTLKSDVSEAKEAAISEIQGATDSAETAALEAIVEAREFAEGAISEGMNAVIARAEQISRMTTSAEEIAAQALSTANNAENHMASLDSQMQALEASLQDVSIDPDDLGLYQDEDTYYVYPTYKGVVSENGIPLSGPGGGGGGGGTDVVTAILSVENTSGWLSKTIPSGAACPVSFTWSSIEDDLPTGDGSIRITVNNVVRTTYQIAQGNVAVDLAPFLSTGANKVKVRISDTYDQGKTTTFNITAIALSISSTFDPTEKYSGAITFPVTPVGAVEKTIHRVLDGVDTAVITTSVSNRQLSFTIPAQSHGAHTLMVYFEAVINNETVRSNELYYEFTAVDPVSDETIITSSYHNATEAQYTNIAIPFMVYDPLHLTAEVKIYVNGTLVSTQTVDRTEQSFAYKANTVGVLHFRIIANDAAKEFDVTVIESEIDVQAETEDLVLYLTSQGRSNNEEHPDTWAYGEGTGRIAASFTGFNWASDGWQKDADGVTVMRVSGDARITIPYRIFATDFRSTGKTIELEFSTRNVLNYDATILSCMSGGRGISLTAQKAMLSSEQSEISTQYKEDEHNRISFVVEKRSGNRLLSIYINGVQSGCVRYPVDDDFAQTEPVDISIGSSDCTIDLYTIRIYDNDLTSDQIVDNWIADTQDGTAMLERYVRNSITDAYGNIVISSLPYDLPYLLIECDELPQYKGDKKTCSITFVHPLYPSKSFTSENVQIDIQGTSSQYYPRKNYKTKHKAGFTGSSGSTSETYAMNADAVPTNSFCYKADFASSEGANNVELARLYNSACPYKTPAQVLNSKVRQGIDGFPMVVFWHDTRNDETAFLGKYNYNNDKGTAEVFGFSSPDESWEIKNNTGLRVLWKSADYYGSDWLNDFEARYPDTDPAYEDPAQLAEFAAWAASTDTEAATGNALPAPVTYGKGDDAVTYTNDTAAYRLAKFKAEAGNYMELQSALFYYLFTELFLMIDSRAKNAFPSFIGSEVSA